MNHDDDPWGPLPPLQPLPATREALDELVTYGDEAVADVLPILARRVQSHVPQLVGLSMAVLQHGLTFTLASSALDIAVIDAAQYLDGGPCVDAVHRGEAIAANPGDPLDEAQWQLFSQLASARGIRSTLSLPLYDDGSCGEA